MSITGQMMDEADAERDAATLRAESAETAESKLAALTAVLSPEPGQDVVEMVKLLKAAPCSNYVAVNYKIMRELDSLRAALAEKTSQLENVLDTSKEGAWQARALDAERENARLRERVAELEKKLEQSEKNKTFWELRCRDQLEPL